MSHPKEKDNEVAKCVRNVADTRFQTQAGHVSRGLLPGRQARQLHTRPERCWEVARRFGFFYPNAGEWQSYKRAGRRPQESHFCECCLCAGLGARLLPQWQHRGPCCEAARCCQGRPAGFSDRTVCSGGRRHSLSLLCSLFIRGTSLTQERCCWVQSKHKPKLKCCIQHQSHNWA